VTVPGMAVPSMDVFFSGKKLIFDAHFMENANFFLLYAAELIFAD
jgi:hypothetical protein